jgi:apolipoprotein N-acyltransferase
MVVEEHRKALRLAVAGLLLTLAGGSFVALGAMAFLPLTVVALWRVRERGSDRRALIIGLSIVTVLVSAAWIAFRPQSGGPRPAPGLVETFALPFVGLAVSLVVIAVVLAAKRLLRASKRGAPG